MAMDLARLSIAVNSVEAVSAVNEARKSFRGLKTDVGDANEELENTSRIGSAVKTALASLFTVFTVQKVLQIADEFKSLQNQLKLVSDSSLEAERSFQRLMISSNKAGTSIKGAISLYSSLRRATKDLGTSSATLATVVGSINNAIAASKAPAQAAEAALYQLSQGFAAGTLRGDEFRSVMEQTPRVAQLLAEGLGVTMGALRDMSMEGELTSDRLIYAFSVMSSEIQAEMDSMEKSISQNFQVVQNVFFEIIGRADQVTGATKSISNSLKEFGEQLKDPNVQRGMEQMFNVLVAGLETAGKTTLFLVTHFKTLLSVLAAASILKVVWGLAKAWGAWNVGVVATNAAITKAGGASALLQTQLAGMGATANAAAAGLQRVGASAATITRVTGGLTAMTMLSSPIAALGTLLVTLAGIFILLKNNTGKYEDAMQQAESTMRTFGDTVQSTERALQSMHIIQKESARLELAKTIDAANAAMARLRSEILATALEQTKLFKDTDNHTETLKNQTIVIDELQRAIEARSGAEQFIMNLQQRGIELTGEMEDQMTALYLNYYKSAEAAGVAGEQTAILMGQLEEGTATWLDYEDALKETTMSSEESTKAFNEMYAEMKENLVTMDMTIAQEMALAATRAGVPDTLASMAIGYATLNDYLDLYKQALEDDNTALAEQIELAVMATVQNMALSQAVAAGKAVWESAQTYVEKYGDALTDLAVAHFLVKSAESATNAEAATFKKVIDDMIPVIEGAVTRIKGKVKATKDLSSSTKAAAKETSAYKDLQRELAEAIDPLNRLLYEHTDLILALNQEYIAGKISLEELLESYDRATQLLDINKKKLEESAKSTRKAREEIDPYAEAIKRAFERLDDIGVDMWKDMLNGTRNALDAVKKMFYDLLAELLHAAITRPIILSIGTAMTGGVGTASAAGGALDMASGGVDIFSAISGGFSNVIGGLSTSIGTLASTLGMTGVGTGLGATGSIISGAGYFGGAGAALGGAGTLLGAGQIGAAIGMAAPYLLPVLLGAVALSGILDDKTEPRVGLSSRPFEEGTGGLEDNVYRESPFGIIGFRGASHEMDAASEEWSAILDMIAALDEQLAQAMSPEQIAAVQAALGDFEGTLVDLADFDPTALGTMLSERFSVLTQVLETDFGQKLNAWVQDFSGTGEQFAAGLGAWVMALTAIDQFDLSGVLVDDLAEWLDTFEGSGEEFLAGTRAWLIGMKALQDASFESVGAFGLGDMAKGVFEDFFSAFMNQLDPAQFEAGATAFANLVQAMDFDPMVEGTRMFEEANRSAWESLGVLSDGVWDAIDSFDGSVESIQQLAQATGSFKGAAAQMIAAIEQIKQSIAGMTANTIEQMKTSLMSEEEKTNYYIDQANQLKMDLAEMTDPAQIESAVAKINELVLGAFNLLPEEMRAGFLDFAEPFLLDTEELANKRLEAAKEEITGMTTAIEGAITSALGKVAADFQAAANSMNAAANAIPTEIDANVTVTVNNTGGFGEGDTYSELGA